LRHLVDFSLGRFQLDVSINNSRNLIDSRELKPVSTNLNSFRGAKQIYQNRIPLQSLVMMRREAECSSNCSSLSISGAQSHLFESFERSLSADALLKRSLLYPVDVTHTLSFAPGSKRFIQLLSFS